MNINRTTKVICLVLVLLFFSASLIWNSYPNDSCIFINVVHVIGVAIFLFIIGWSGYGYGFIKGMEEGKRMEQDQWREPTQRNEGQK